MPVIKLPSGREVELNDLDQDVLGSGGIPSNIPRDHPPGWTPAYGAPPEIPDPIASMWKAIGGNIEALPSLFSLGNAYNLFNYDQRLGQLKGTPGYEGIAANLRGELPQDVVSQIAQRSAERGVGSGMSPDAPNLNAAYLRAIGLNSLQQQQLGQQQQNALLGLYPQAAPFDVSKYLSNPDDIQAAELAARVQAAAPDPAAAAKAEQARLLEAIAAGKAAAGGGGGPAGGVDYSKIMDLIKAMGGGGSGSNAGPGVVVGKGPNQTIDRGYTPPSFTPPVNYRDPGASGFNAQGIRSDAVKGASDYINQIFSTPSYANNNTRGGLGLDPSLNAVIAGLGPQSPASNGSFFYPGMSDFGAPITAPDLSYGSGAGSMFSSNLNDTYFGQPITSSDLWSGQNYSDWAPTVFNTPSYDYSSSLGGLGLDPTLNALLGSGGLFDKTGFSPTTVNDMSNFGSSLFPNSGGSYFDSLFNTPSFGDDSYLLDYDPEMWDWGG